MQEFYGMDMKGHYRAISDICSARGADDFYISDGHKTFITPNKPGNTISCFPKPLIGARLELADKLATFVPAMKWFFSFRKIAISFIFFFSLFSVFQMSGQYGPMGFGNADGSEAPAGYAQPKLLLWLDGSSVTVANNQNVMTWPDKSGNGHHFISETGAVAPVFRSTGGPSNRPYVEFSKADNRMYCSNFTMSPDGYTIYFVIRTNDSKYGIFNYGSMADPHELIIFNDDANGFIRQHLGAETRTTAIGDISNSQWRYGGLVHDIGSLLWEYNIGNQASDENASSFGSSATISSSGTAIIGNIQQTLNGGFLPLDALQGDVAEIIVFEGALSRPHTRLMRTYLWTKYGSPFSTAGGWDKFQGFAPGSGGEYYEPIAVGRDNGSPNSGEQCEARLKGLVLRVNPGQWTQSRTYLCAGHIGASNAIVTTDLPVGVQARWSRVWEIGASNDGTGQQYRVGFDFGEGINGDFPQVADNFVLLRRTGNSGTFAEVPSSQIVEKAIVDDEVVFTIIKSNIDDANQFYTIGTKNSTVSTLNGSTIRTWYAYQSGNWNNPFTWTLDGSAAPSYVNPGSAIPAANDNVAIGPGRVVTANVNGITQTNVTVDGTLDVGTVTAPTFSIISGFGLIRCAGNGVNSNFPTGNTNAFAHSSTGGTVEFYGAGGITQSTNLVVKDLILNFNTPTQEFILAADLTHNGGFEISSGTLRINNGANVTRTLFSNGDVYVTSNGRIRVNSYNRIHNWNVHANIQNEGQIYLTQRISPLPGTADDQGRMALRVLNPNVNQTINTNGALPNGSFYVWRVVVDKGMDKTYELQISANAENRFVVMGECIDGGAQNEYETEAQNTNAVAIINGTLRIKQNIFLPLQVGTGGQNYNINHTATLWIDGGSAAKGIHPSLPTTANPQQAIVVYGELKVTSGTLFANCKSGVTLRGNGLLQVDGGIVYANQIRTSIFGPTNIGGYIQNGGTVYVDGSKPGGTQNTFYAFSMTYPGNLFRMTGGNLHVTGPNGSGLIFIGSDPAQTSVTGGTVHLDVSDDNNNYNVSSKAAFWNLRITRSIVGGSNRPVVIKGGSTTDNSVTSTILDLPLIVKGNLSIGNLDVPALNNTPTLQMGPSSLIPADLHVNGNMSITGTGVYNHYTNTTYFTGNANSFLNFPVTTKTFYNVVIDKFTDTRFAEIQTSSASVAMNILGNLQVERGFFVNNTREVHVKGNIVNRSTIGNDLSTGDLILNGTTGEQYITSQGAIFHGLVINNADGVYLQSDGVVVRRRIDFASGSFFIGDQKLRMETTLDPFTSVDQAGRFVVCNGSASAGGVEILYHNASQNTTFPVGLSTLSDLKYTPATIRINSGFVDDGYIRITPVDTFLTTADVTVNTNYLNYYWRVSHTDFEDVPLVSHEFLYDDDDVEGDDELFASGRVLQDLPFDREVDELITVLDHVNTISNLIYYNGDDADQNSAGIGTLLINADYSAGDPLRFFGRPSIFFSRSNNFDADWNLPSSWNEMGVDFDDTDGVYDFHSSAFTSSNNEIPGEGSIVFIGFDVNDANLKPHSYAAPAGGILAAEVRFTPLQDLSGNRLARYEGPNPSDITILRPTLRLGSNTQLGLVKQISGEGTLLLTGDVNLGLADVGGFMQEDSSIVMVVPISSTINLNTLPSTIPNLFITSAIDGNGANITRLHTDIEIKGNLEVAGKGKFYLSNGAGGNIIVNGDLILASYQSTGESRLLFNQNGPSKKVVIKGDLILDGSSSRIDIDGNDVNPPPPVVWTPTQVAANFWIDADDATTITHLGGVVSQWRDKIGTNHAYQVSAGNQPEYIATGINGKGAIRFDGGDDFLRINHQPLFNIPANQDFEIFTVVKPNDKNNHAIFSKGGVHATDLALYYWQNAYRLRFQGGTMEMLTNTGGSLEPNYGYFRRQGANSALYNSKGGMNTRSNVNGAIVSNTSHLSIGAILDGTERFFDGDIAEIIFIKRALTTDERQKMEGYLAHKWGLTGDLPAGHPYKNTAPLLNEDNTAMHNLETWGNVKQNITGNNPADGIHLYRSNTYRRVNLNLRGDGNHTFEWLDGPDPDLWSVTMDKGFNTNSSFAWNSNLNVFGPTDESKKSIDLQNGLLKFNAPNIDLTLSSGGGDYFIPGSAGIELNDGELLVTGNGIGLLLDGLLKITGGTFTIGDNPVQNNYLEYSSNATAKINVSGGSLLVGTQLRRGLTNTAGILDYRQSGGNVEIGRFGAPNTNRGVFEIINPGSRFDHTSGTLTLVRGVNSLSTPSLLIDPEFSNVSNTSEIIIGNASSPGGAEIENFGVRATIPLNALTINNESGNDPKIRVQENDLTLEDLLTIEAGASLNIGVRKLFLNDDLINDGFLGAQTGAVILTHNALGSVSGSGTYDLYDLQRNGGAGGLTVVDTDLTLRNEFHVDYGEIDFGPHFIDVQGDVHVDGRVTFSSVSEGLIFSGNVNQLITRSGGGLSYIDVITINNSQGVKINGGAVEVIVEDNLRLARGVFNLNGNLLEMGINSVFTELNPFGETNMISTGGAFSNFGVRKYVPAFSTEDIFIPLGIDKYMPIRLDFNAPGNSSGDQVSNYLFKLNIPQHPIIVDDDESLLDPPQPVINDLLNVLGMYFSMDVTNVGSGMKLDVEFQYDDSYVQTTNPLTEEDYVGARVYSNELNDFVFKFGTGAVDADNNIIRFSFDGVTEEAIDGDYFAGVESAIPEVILAYTTDVSGNVNAGATTYVEEVPGGGAPAGARVNVVGNHILLFNINGINFYRTFIDEDATVEIDQTSFHRLGTVTGTGTIKLNGTGNLPSGQYNEFFSCFGGKLIYEGSTDDNFEILANLPIVRKVDVIGAGIIQIANSDIQICEDLTIDGPTVRASNNSDLVIDGDLLVNGGIFDLRQGDLEVAGSFITSGSSIVQAGSGGFIKIDENLILGGSSFSFGNLNHETILKGNLIKNSGAITGGTAGAALIMNNSLPQYIEGNFTGTGNNIRFLEIQNPSGITLHSNVEIVDTLVLGQGHFYTGVDSFLVLQNEGVDVVPIGGSQNSHIKGPMQWNLQTGPEVTFPIGKGERFRPLKLDDRSAPRTWTAEYFDTTAVVHPDVTSLTPYDNVTIKSVSKQEHWVVSTNTGSTLAKVGLSWGENSGVGEDPNLPPEPGDYDKLVVLGYSTTTGVWDSYGSDLSSFNYSPGNDQGNFIAADLTSFSEKIFTIGSSDAVNPLPVTFLYFRGSTNGTYHALTWATGSETNNDYFALQRSIDGQYFQTIAMIEGAGNSNTTRHYDYVDKVAPHGRVYYRLQQVDFDGQTAFAPNIVTLYKEEVSAPLDFVIYPNPTRNGEVRLNISEFEAEMVLVSITDLTGKTLDRQTLWVDEQGITQPFQCQFEPGIYLVSIIVNDQLRSKPLVISR